MAVKIKAIFSEAKIRKMMADRLNNINTVIINRLTFIGEKFVKNARDDGAYTDRTGNLRNSIGYVVVHNGKILSQDFSRSANVTRVIKSGKNKGKEKTTSGSSEGLNTSKTLVKQIISDHPKGAVLIVVAGMNYAAAVEAKGFDVITASSLIAVADLKRAVKELKSKIGKIK